MEMQSKTVERILQRFFQGDEWNIVSADKDFAAKASCVQTLEDLEKVMIYGSHLINQYAILKVVTLPLRILPFKK